MLLLPLGFLFAVAAPTHQGFAEYQAEAVRQYEDLIAYGDRATRVAVLIVDFNQAALQFESDDTGPDAHPYDEVLSKATLPDLVGLLQYLSHRWMSKPIERFQTRRAYDKQWQEVWILTSALNKNTVIDPSELAPFFNSKCTYVQLVACHGMARRFSVKDRAWLRSVLKTGTKDQVETVQSVLGWMGRSERDLRKP